MLKAIVILTALVGYNVAVKIFTILKMMGMKVENMEQKDFEELLKDPRFRKYMR